VPGSTEIPNYKPPDEGWSVVAGRFRPKPEPKPTEKPERDAETPAVEDTE
jgi:hypothetical protein